VWFIWDGFFKDKIMKEPEVSTADSCPSCNSIDWKLAKMLVLEGMTIINSKSSGGGFGVSAGSSGIGVNYQGIDLSTNGTQKVAMVDEYAPPKPPREYIQKDSLIKKCSEALENSAQIILRIDEFAQNTVSINPGFFSNANKNSTLLLEADNYKKASEQLLGFQKYELEKAIWERTRVCGRCGDSFITPKDKQLAKSNINIPKYSFVGKDRQCPNCHSYQWKTASAYYSILILQLEKDVQEAKVSLEEAREYSSKPKESGFWAWMARPLLTPLTIDKSEQILKDQTIKLDDVLKEREQAHREYLNFSVLRVCADCKTQYKLKAS
jgi:ribosomal protein S27AE